MNPDIISETIDRTTAPIVHDMGPLTLPDDEIVTLQNGISLHLLSGGDAEVSRIKILLPGGIAESPVPQLYQWPTRCCSRAHTPTRPMNWPTYSNITAHGAA